MFSTWRSFENRFDMNASVVKPSFIKFKAVILFLPFAAMLYIGISIVYGALVPLDKMKKIDAQVLYIKSVTEQATKSRSWHLEFTLLGRQEVIRLNYNTETEAKQDKTLYSIRYGKTYTFYLNASDVHSIAAIDYKNIPIYRKPRGVRIFVGLILSFVGLLLLYILIMQTIYGTERKRKSIIDSASG